MSKSKPCIFCEILAGRLPAEIIAENELSVCLLDINPFSEGHSLVIPRRHVPWWHDLTPAETASLFDLARTVSRKMMKVLKPKPDFVAIYARGRRIPHTHIFLVPTWGGDLLDRYFNDLEKVQEHSPELAALRSKKTLAATAKKLRKP